MIASLDVIPGEPNMKLTPKIIEDASIKGYLNYEKMLRKGVHSEKLLHTFHQGDNEKWLVKLIEKGVKYIGVSPANDRTTKQRKQWLDTIMPIILDSKGIPKVKFHGFGVTSIKLVLDFPWYSVDSSSWRLRGGGFGMIDIPTNPNLNEKKDYYIKQLPISQGVKTYTKNESNGLFDMDRISQCDVSFNKLPKLYKKKIEELLFQYGFTLKELEQNATLRSIWNAIYLITTVKKFSNTKIYLAAGDINSLKLLKKHMLKNNIKTDLNVLVSFINKGMVKKLIQFKNENK
jgi:hypothetical protein